MMLNFLRIICYFFYQLIPFIGVVSSFALDLNFISLLVLAILIALSGVFPLFDFEQKFSRVVSSDTEVMLFRLINRCGPVVFIVSVLFWLYMARASSGIIDLLIIYSNLAIIPLFTGQYLHELSHSKINIDKIFCKVLSIAMGYGHYKREHVSHHKDRVYAAFRDESSYSYIFRNYIKGFTQSYAKDSMNVDQKQKSLYHHSFISNYSYLAAVFLFVVAVFGIKGFIGYLVCIISFLLSTQLFYYVSHYGLIDLQNRGRELYGGSWDSIGVIDRLFFSSSGRHSEHHKDMHLPHYLLGRKPPSIAILPLSYPLMMLIALIPWIYTKIINSILDKLNDGAGRKSQF